MNVLHAPVNVASQASSMARAERDARRRCGRRGTSWSVDFLPSPLSSSADEVKPNCSTFLTVTLGRLLRLGAAMQYALANLRRFDAIHLYFGQTMRLTNIAAPVLGQMDLPLWKSLGKKVFMTFQGCDARIKGASASEPISACAPGVCRADHCHDEADTRKRRSIKMIARFCDKLFCLNPDLLQFVPGAEFLPYANLDPDWLSVTRRNESLIPTIAHAPTDRAIKGTHHVLEASARLREVIPHDLVLVENLPRAKAIELYADATLLVDQLHVGWYGGLAVEAMALGLPVVAYLNERHLEWIPTQMRAELPVVSATPENLQHLLADLLRNPQRRKELGERGRSYVKRWHDPFKIAGRMLDLYEDPSLSFWDGYRPEA